LAQIIQTLLVSEDFKRSPKSAVIRRATVFTDIINSIITKFDSNTKHKFAILLIGLILNDGSICYNWKIREVEIALKIIMYIIRIKAIVYSPLIDVLKKGTVFKILLETKLILSTYQSVVCRCPICAPKPTPALDST